MENLKLEEVTKQLNLIDVTLKAREQIKRIIETEKHKGEVCLRLGVVGGGCSGFSYKMEFSQKSDKDNQVDFGSFKVVIDPKSTIYLKGLVLDYKDGLEGKGFIFSNPNASNTCVCGESFSI